MDEKEKAKLRRLYKVVDAMRDVDAILPIQTFAAFLVVALEDGQSITAIGDKIGLSQSAASRNLSSLAEWDWRKKTGLKLVEYRQDRMNLSVKTCHLTPKGQKLVQSFVDILEGRAA
jgi:DNA-binding MarR family transcriptional regulator